MKEKKTVSIALPLDIYEKINILAQETCRTRAGYIRQILRVSLRHLEESIFLEDCWKIK